MGRRAWTGSYPTIKYAISMVLFLSSNTYNSFSHTGGLPNYMRFLTLNNAHFNFRGNHTSLPILPKDSLRCTGLFLDAMLPPSKPAVGIPFYLVMHQMLTNAVPKLMASKRSIRLWHLLSQEEKKLWLKTKDIWCREKKLLISAKISVRRSHTKDAQRKMEQNAIH